MGADSEKIRLAFSRVKEDIADIYQQILEIKEEIRAQNLRIEEILIQSREKIKEPEKPKLSSSIGNEGVNQSINQSLINQSITNHTPKKPEMAENEAFEPPNEEIDINQIINQSITNQSLNQTNNQIINQKTESQLKTLTNNMNKLFISLSKQELKLFLTIYQFEDDGIKPTYKNISLKMQLSEHCIRSHLSSLLRKNAPILKTKLNNKLVVLSLSKDFRALNLKKSLIGLYYEADPHQKTLFDV